MENLGLLNIVEKIWTGVRLFFETRMRRELETAAANMSSAATVRIIKAPINNWFDRWVASGLADKKDGYAIDGDSLVLTWRHPLAQALLKN